MLCRLHRRPSTHPVKMKLFAFYLLTSFACASLGYALVYAALGESVFGGLYRMFVYHQRHPFQYIGLACAVFAVVAATFTSRVARTGGWRRVSAIVAIMLGSVVIASAPGGVLWSVHDMQAGYFPTGERFWQALVWGATTGLQTGWLIIAISFPFNVLGLIVGYFIMNLGIRLTVNAP